ncbi:hypothetical protein TWF481_001833 [Arthrobotrys musiformis]|uniref:F-box domain-containing protein n=1 Tax=Arthrobotrys musiformis TaxID=47236 RepID=A0AAV9VWH9_9PEZI
MSIENSNSLRSLLGSFNKPTSMQPPIPNPLKYIDRPDPSLDGIPLEILLQIASYLPAHTAVILSCANSSLHRKLAGSQFFWYKFGSQSLKRFKKFNPKYNYHGYIIKAASGGIKTTCQLCLTPKVGIFRGGIDKIVCTDCLEENIVLEEAVQRIPGIDLTRLRKLHTQSFPRGKPYLDIPELGLLWTPKTPCYWLPAVKKEVERVYYLPWGAAIGPPAIDDIRPLVSPKEIRDYYKKVSRKILDATVEKFWFELGMPFVGILDPDTFRRIWAVQLPGIDLKLLPPAEGQTDMADYEWIVSAANKIHEVLFGPHFPTFPPYVRNYPMGAFWHKISGVLLNRLTAAGKNRGNCGLCTRNTDSSGSESEYTDDLEPIEFLAHVTLFHPEKLFFLDHTWRL